MIVFVQYIGITVCHNLIGPAYGQVKFIKCGVDGLVDITDQGGVDCSTDGLGCRLELAGQCIKIDRPDGGSGVVDDFSCLFNLPEERVCRRVCTR